MRVDLWLSTWMISIIIICSELKYFARHCPVYLSQVQSNDFLSFVWYPIMIKKSDAIAESNSLGKLQRMRNHIPLLSWQTEHFLPFLLQSEDCTCRTFFCCYVFLWATNALCLTIPVSNRLFIILAIHFDCSWTVLHNKINPLCMDT